MILNFRSRSHRGAVAVFLAFALIGASQGDSGKPQHGPHSQDANQVELTRLANALENLPRSSALDRGCRTGEDDRKSNLCAEWKGADAAAASAWWAMLTFAAGGLIGLFTLIFAAKAARWAKKAAIETERSANAASEALSLTERVSYSQLLPLVQIKIVPERIHSRNDIIAIDYVIDLKNLGGSEAKNVIANAEVLFGSENSIIEAWERLKVHRTWLFKNDISILPGETISRPAQELKPSAEIRFSMNPGTVDPSFTVVFVASASYTFTFGERATRERTERVFMLRFKSSVDLLSAFVTEASLPVERDRLFIDQISLGPILPLDSD